MKTVTNSPDELGSILPSGSPGQALYLDISSDPVWQTPPDPGLTSVNFVASPYLVATTTFSGRIESTQINLVTTGTGANVLTSNLPETYGIVLLDSGSPLGKITLKPSASFTSYTLQLPDALKLDAGYLVVRANGTTFIDVPRSAQYFASSTQAIPANTPTTVLYPTVLSTITGITYLAGTFTVTKTCVALLTTSIPLASSSSRRMIYFLKNASAIKYGMQSINDVPASIESISATTILNFDAGDTFKVIVSSTSATSTTISGTDLAQLQIYLL